MSTYSLRHLSNDAVTRELAAATTTDRRSTASHLAHIAEFDHRRLYVPEGYASMFRYCVGRLGMSEDAALQRIRAGRVALQFPAVFQEIADGRLHVTAVVLIGPYLHRGDPAELMSVAAGLTSKQIHRLLAERFGRSGRMLEADVSARPSQAGDEFGADPAGPVDVLGLNPVALAPAEVRAAASEQAPGPARAESEAVPSAGTTQPAKHARLSPIAPGRFELVAILGQEAYDQLVASRDLLGHAVPSGGLAEVIERAIALQFAQLRRRRCGAADRPRNGTPHRSANPRQVPNSVRRAVWERDGGQCTFVGSGGHRCESRDRLELDHIVPVARGGEPTLENLRLLCRVHNQFTAEREFGAAAIQGRREAARRRRIGERLRREADRERTETRKREIARQHEELGEALRALGYRGDDLRRALAYCAERAGAPPEQRLRHALGCMAPNVRRECPSLSA